MEVNKTANYLRGMYKTASRLWYLCQRLLLASGYNETSENPKVSGILQDNGTVIFKSVKVMRVKKKLTWEKEGKMIPDWRTPEGYNNQT